MSDQATVNNGNPPKAVVEAINKILIPLVRLLLNFRITYPQVSELLKKAYVVVAVEKEFELNNKPQTNTRLSLLTGIDRKSVMRFRDKGTEKSETPDVISTGSKLVSHWNNEPKYLSTDGVPLALPLKGKAKEPSFESLVQDIFRQDMRPRVVLDEWLSMGVVTKSDDNIISLNSQAFIPSKGLEEKAFFFGHNVADHLSASANNLLDKERVYFERCVYYDGLVDDTIEEIEKHAKKRGNEVILELDKLTSPLKTKDMAKKLNKNRLNIGVFVYHEPEDSEK